MLDLDAFLTELYVLIDDWDKTQPPDPVRPGPRPQLSRSEVLTLAVVGQNQVFRSEHGFWQYAQRTMRPWFPCLPSREQFNQAVRRYQDALSRLAVAVGQLVVSQSCPYEILDATGVPTRDLRRRGRGWMPGDATKGQCTRLGWYVGVRVLLCTTPTGAITGYGVAPANTNDRRLAETLLECRATPSPALPGAGVPATAVYLADGGFTGVAWEAHWRTEYHAEVICPPQLSHRRKWSKQERRHHASLRQIVESVTDKLLRTFRLATDRAHTLTGLLARIAAKVAAHNAWMWINQQHNRAPMAFADLVAW